MPRLLIITHSYNPKNAAGAVFSSLFKELGLRDNWEVEVICSDFDQELSREKVIKLKNGLMLPERVHKLLTVILGVFWENFFWKIRVKSTIKKYVNEKLDWIVALPTGNKPEVVQLAYFASNFLKAPLYIHMVDPIPAPAHWGQLELYRTKLLEGIKPGFKHALLCSFNNEKMRDYQLSSLDIKPLETQVFMLPDPLSSDFLHLPLDDFDPIVITFLGNFYGERKPDIVFHALGQLIAKGYHLELRIYGNCSKNFDDFEHSDVLSKIVKFMPFTKDLTKVYKDSHILLDVDVNAEDNVFSSSKVKRYLFVNRPILSISNAGSPTRLMINKLKSSVFRAEHDFDSVVHAIEDCVIKMKAQDIDYEERLPLINNLSLSSAVDKVVEALTFKK